MAVDNKNERGMCRKCGLIINFSKGYRYYVIEHMKNTHGYTNIETFLEENTKISKQTKTEFSQ